jgi:hypothetical protein
MAGQGAPAFPTTDRVAHLGMSLRQYYAAHAPVSYEMACAAWGDQRPFINDDATRAGFMAVWAMLRFEYAEAMLHEERR